jgi:hypothetical protein
MLILAVDSHVRSMAWAMVQVETEKPMGVGTVKAPKGLTQQGCQDFWNGFAANPSTHGYTDPFDGACHLAIEIPDHLKSKSNKQLQDLVALGMCAAAFCQGWTAHTRTYDQVQPRDWKGRKTKEATRFEMEAACGKSRATTWTEHEVDAVALGLWWCRNAKSTALHNPTK